ncbi:hypothetical protein BOTCAL_0136g00310 [Botryotinia calthae]|uniref:Uncharacterized protein n=1 Tax=Botryotinia calthae TaxID=38488 RepID=A0A4Y8D3H4_9HELO|nr:hypothetical protein BOTCAL_0136g00310 [Botryotinia calthae]
MKAVTREPYLPDISNTAYDEAEKTSHLKGRACRLISSSHDAPPKLVENTIEDAEFKHRVKHTLASLVVIYYVGMCRGEGSQFGVWRFDCGYGWTAGAIRGEAGHECAV